MVRLSGTSAHRINPFDLPAATDDAEGRDPLAERVLALQGLLGVMLADPGRPLGQVERGVLDAALYETYRQAGIRSEEHTSELQSLMRISYAVFCLKKKKKTEDTTIEKNTLIPTTQ